MLGNKTWNEWISEYSSGHQNTINRFCHTIGIPLIVISILLFLPALFITGLWKIALGLFILGWLFQFIGHAFEGKPPEFFKTGVFFWLDYVGGSRN